MRRLHWKKKAERGSGVEKQQHIRKETASGEETHREKRRRKVAQLERSRGVDCTQKGAGRSIGASTGSTGGGRRESAENSGDG